MFRRLVGQDLVWAGLIFLLASAFGLGMQWRLVQRSWRGELRPFLISQKEQRLQKEFQGIKTLSLAQTFEIFQKGQALFIDARTPEDYAELHIPGAINLNRERLDREGAQALAGIPNEREMVVYCAMSSCEAALNAAEKLQALGYRRVQVFMGGFRAWDDAGYPADTSK